MLEQLFGSKTRVRLLRLFFDEPQAAFFVRELTRKIGAQINAVRNELTNLMHMGILTEVGAEARGDDEEERAKDKRVAQRKYYKLAQDSTVYPELRALFLKSRILVEKDFVRKLSESGSVGYLALTGYFTGVDDAPTDVLMIGRINRDRVAALIRAFQKEVGREINYTVMTPQEYKYRREVTDRFLYSILESKKIVVVDTVQEKELEAA
jgi:predicted transcriptional regulator